MNVDREEKQFEVIKPETSPTYKGWRDEKDPVEETKDQSVIETGSE